MSPRHGGPARELDASMTLLSEVYRKPLDPGYQQAALRRERGEGHRSRGQTAAVLAITLVLGLFVTAAAVELRRPSAAAVQARALLEGQIAEQQDRAADAQTSIRNTTGDLDRMQAEALSDEAPALLVRLRRDAASSGVSGVSGPGLQVVMSDAPAPDGQDEPDPAQRVQDVDLQVVVNGLWSAGAEAIAVNGVRLTTTTAIRSAGSAVLVDLQALSSPYTVEAIGDVQTMQTGLGSSTAGQHLATLKTNYGISTQISAKNEMILPGTGQVTLQFATAIAEDEDSAGAAEAMTPGSTSPETVTVGPSQEEGRSS